MNITFVENSPLVLIVDDDNFQRLQIGGMLEDEGYRLVEATDGEQGLAAFSEYSPDIVLLDALMPVMDGFTCCQKLRQLPQGANIPILMITSLEDKEYVDRAFSAGASDYITKPVHLAVLRQRVLRMLQASRAEAEIRKALEKERELNELKSRFVSMTSHEFRAPMNTILSSAELLEHFGHKFNEEKKLKHLHRIQAAVKKMTHLLNDVLLIGKVEAGKQEFNPTPLDLVKLCSNMVEEMQLGTGEHHQIVFTHQGSCQNACMDEELLESILTNLLSNAIKYSPKGGEVNLFLVGEQGKAIFRVQDRGIGITEADRAQLFSHFHRGVNVGNISGTGLGLAIVKNCVDLHGGKIAVESELGVGTTFIVTLPSSQ